MPRHVWTVMCVKGVLDKFTNTVSLHDVLEEIHIKPDEEFRKATSSGLSVTISSIKVQLVSLWIRSNLTEGEEFETRAVLVLPDRTEIAPNDARHVDLTQYKRMRQFFTVEGFRYGGPGEYHFAIQWRANGSDWATVARVPLEVAIQGDDTVPPAAAPTKAAVTKRKKKAARR